MTEIEQHQGMSRAVVAKLLALVQSYDRKFIVEDPDVLAFHDVAVRYRWTFHEAETQIRKWGAEEAAEGFMSPAKLNSLIRAARQDVLMRQPVATAYGPRMMEETTRQRIMAVWRDELQASKLQSKARRELVLAHEDLRAALCAPSLGYSRPENWNGWIPPELDPYGARNDSPRRAALVAIVDEADRRAAS